jgi:phage tail protein X
VLFDPARHEPLAELAWEEALARAAIERIVADTERAFTPAGLWPIHPADLSPERPPDCLKPLYHGAAGVIWALTRLAEAGGAALLRDYRATAMDLDRRQREDLAQHPGVAAYMGRERPAFLIGETGTLLLQWKLTGEPTLLTRLENAVAALVGDPRGVVWGGAGAMHVALHLHAATAEPRWATLFQHHAEALWSSWAWAPGAGCHLWTQDLYGVIEARLSALHGFAANAQALLRGQHLLSPDRCAETIARIRVSLLATAVREEEMANWPLAAPRGSDEPWRVQHCIGSPGMVTALADLPSDPEVDALLLAAGELTWRAGPVTKLPGLCHGAPGAGYAFLKLHGRSGDERWLQRARRFAMHAVGQSERALAVDGRRKYSLWTGDLGLAVFLWDCVRVASEYPTLDVF